MTQPQQPTPEMGQPPHPRHLPPTGHAGMPPQDAPAPQHAPGQQGAPAPQGEMPVAEAIGLVKVYGEGENQVTALKGVNVSFQRGSFTAIMGPSGSGKSTLMHCMAGLDGISQGRVIINGQDLQVLPDNRLTEVRRDKIGFIFQSFNLLPTLTATQNIVLPLDLAGRKVDQAWFDQITQALGLTDRLSHRPSELSGGQQQRVAIARALVTRPEVIFADEPTGALDTRTGTALLDFMRRSVRELGQSIIMVTHDPKAAAYADRALVLVDGQIVDDIHSPTVDSVNAAMARLEA